MQSPADVTKRWTLILCCLAQFMVILDVSVVNVALPSIRNDLGFSVVDLQWVVNAYTLTFAGFLLLGGRAADLLGHSEGASRRAGCCSRLASLAGGLSQGQGQLIVARAFQGLGGAVVAPATLSVLTTTFTEGTERNRALSVWGAMGAAGGAAGALVGGILTDVLGWQWILFINVPIGLVAVLAGRRFIVEHARSEAGQRHYDALGAVTVTAGLMLLTFGIVSTDDNGWGSAAGARADGGRAGAARRVPGDRGPLLAAPADAAPRVRRPQPLGGQHRRVLPGLRGVRDVVLRLAAISSRCSATRRSRPALAFLPMTAAIALASTFAGRLSSRVGPGIVLTGGMTLIALGMARLLVHRRRAAATGRHPRAVRGHRDGLGFSFVPVTIAAMAGVRREEAGLASGLINTSRQFGGSLGLAVLATIASSRTSALADGGHTAAAALTGGFSAAFWVGAGFAALGALAAGVGLARTPARQPEPVPQNA